MEPGKVMNAIQQSKAKMLVLGSLVVLAVIIAAAFWVQITRAEGGEELGAGESFQCAVRAGEVWCWGKNDQGQLGDGQGGSPDSVAEASVQVVGLSAVQSLSTGQAHACALADGAVWCWGNNDNAQLGEGVASGFQQRSLTPVEVSGLPGVATAVSVGFDQAAPRWPATCGAGV